MAAGRGARPWNGNTLGVTAWLQGLGLGRYGQVFRDNDIDAGLLPTLTGDDLRELGVLSLGHRKQLLRAIAELGRAPAQEPAPQQAERRQLTVMFVDLVGSTALSSRLDPEEMREVLHAYQNAVTGEIARVGGHLAKLMGDGVLAYFGWPRANEDDAERAVQAGLTIIRTVRQLSAPTGEPLAARVGIATGLVIVGELIGDGAAREEAVVGETPNLAARLQEVASAGSVVISAGTRQLLGNAFDLRPLEALRLKGFDEPVGAFEALRPHPRESRFDTRRSERAVPMIGRDQELALVLERWRRAMAGEGQAVLVTGEAGIGKSRLVQALLDEATAHAHIALRYQCSPHHTGTPLWPVIQQLTFAAGLAPDDGDDEKLGKTEALLRQATEDIAEAAPLVAALLGIDASPRYPPQDLTAQQRRVRTQDALVRQLVGLERRHPVLVVVEDAHWIDPTSFELFSQILGRIATMRVLMLFTSRPDNRPDLAGYSYVGHLALSRLGRHATEAIVAQLSGSRDLSSAVLGEIAARTDGVPLFIEELTKAVLEAEMTAPAAVPASLSASLMARLDRVPDAREVAQVAACIGREFDYPLLAAISPMPEGELQSALNRLAQAELVFGRGTVPEASYTFKHALVRDAAHESLLKAQRQRIHAKIVRVIEAQFPETVQSAPELIARHCDEARLFERAVEYWLRAGHQAMMRSALTEAIAHLHMGLKVLEELPPGPDRNRHELSLQLALGHSWLHARGFASPETGRSYARAHRLCLELGDAPELPRALYGLCAHYIHRGELGAAFERAQELLSLGIRQDDGPAIVAGHRMVGVALFLQGKFEDSRIHLETGTRLYDRDRDGTSAFTYASDSLVMCLTWLAQDLVVLGYPKQAAARHAEALDHARELSQANTMAMAFAWGSIVPQLLRDRAKVLEVTEGAIAVASELGFPLNLAIGNAIRGWGLATGSRVEEGIALMKSGLEDYEAMEAEILSSYFLYLRAEALMGSGDAAAGLGLLDTALEKTARTQIRWIEAELHRMRGELQLALPEPDPGQAEVSFRHALAIAQEQNAKFWQLRAATSLARLWLEQGQPGDALALLSSVHGWFTEGLDTPDLAEAAAVIESIAGRRGASRSAAPE